MFLLPVQSFAFDEWSKTDIALQAAYTTLHIIDWGQTLNIADEPHKFYEFNPIVGKHPSRARVNYFMASSIVLHTLIVTVLPKEYRPWFQLGTIGVKASFIANNYNVGLNIHF